MVSNLQAIKQLRRPAAHSFTTIAASSLHILLCHGCCCFLLLAQPVETLAFERLEGKVRRPSSIAAGLPQTMSTTSRRSLLLGAGAAFSICCSCDPKPSTAAVTDETDTFADTWWSSKQQLAGGETSTASGTAASNKQAKLSSSNDDDDVVRLTVSKGDLRNQGGLGAELGEIEFRTNLRVYVKSVKPNSVASRLGIQRDWSEYGDDRDSTLCKMVIFSNLTNVCLYCLTSFLLIVIVSINGRSTERTNAKGVAQILASALKDETSNDVELRFRDPSIFRARLKNLSSEEDRTVTTQVAPAGDTTQRRQDGSVRSGYSATEQTEQKITVSQLVPPKMCTRGATTDDLMEISYIGRILETGAIFDGSAVKINDVGIPGRGDDVSLFFVLGKQPFGQFPPGWDVGLVGMCVGERRRLIIPPALAYGSKGLPRRGIPPDAALQYDITLVSLNGLATPQ